MNKQARLLVPQSIPSEPGAWIDQNSIGEIVQKLGCGCPHDPHRAIIQFQIEGRDPVQLEVRQINYVVIPT